MNPIPHAPWFAPALLCAAAFAQALATPPQDLVPTREALAAHYARVEGELASADTSGLDAAQRAARARIVDLLREYRLRGDFGIARAGDAVRVPYFVDDAGRRCAVANLLDRTGCPELTERIAATANQAWVCDLSDQRDLGAWLEAHGITLAEAARIQAPSGRNRQRPPPPPPVPRYDGPGDSARAQAPPPSAPRNDGPGNATGRAAARVGSMASASLRGAPLLATNGGLGADWTGWWQVNRDAFVGGAAQPQSGTLVPELVERMRSDVAQTCNRLLADPNASIRAAAAHALADLQGEEAAGRLVALLADPSQEVRHTAILALGRAGARGTHALSWLVRFGRASSTSPAVSPLAQAVAILALAEARTAGAPGVADDLVASLGAGPAPAPETSFAAMCYRAAAHGAVLGAEAKKLAEAESDPALRCRAIESLARDPARDVVGALMRALSGRDLAARRSAALALAHSADALALPGLLTASELERELLTRGCMLLAVGQRGDRLGGQFLLETLANGTKSLEPFLALALGLHARSRPAPEITAGLVRLLDTSANHEAIGAHLIALGLARCAEAEGRLVATLRSAKSSTVRAHAAEALALLGSAVARKALREQAPDEVCPFVRVAIAEALSCWRNAEDADLVLPALDAAYDAQTDARAIRAAARLRDPAVAAALRARVAAPGTPTRARACALRALGSLLAASEPFPLADLAFGSNWVELPQWFLDLIEIEP